MRFGAIVGVKDEAELLPVALDHLRFIGVESIIVRDNGSTDGTAEFIASRVSPSLRSIPYERQENVDPRFWSIREAALASSMDVDWVLFLDADEFWMPRSGHLQTCPDFQQPETEFVSVPRYNAASAAMGWTPRVPPSDLGQLLLFVRPPADDLRPYLEANPGKSWLTGVPMPKIAARRSRIASIGMGHHEAQGHEGKPLRRTQARELFIAHFPFTSLPRFLRKIDNVRALLSEFPEMFPGHSAWHWKRWAAMSRHELHAEYELQLFSAGELEAFRDAGCLKTAAELLAGNVSA